MTIVKFYEIKKNWRYNNSIEDNNDLLSKLDEYKKLLSIFHPGSYYYYIFNLYTSKLEFISESVKKVLDLVTTDDFIIPYDKSIIHPDDLTYILSFEKAITQFLRSLAIDKLTQYKSSFDYRLKKKDGSYIRLLQQSMVIENNPKGHIIRLLVITTDVTHLNKNGHPTLSFLGLNGEPNFKNIPLTIQLENSKKVNFTKKEKQILKLILAGNTSKKISELLFISKLTVDGHRKSILKKANCKSTLSLAQNHFIRAEYFVD